MTVACRGLASETLNKCMHVLNGCVGYKYYIVQILALKLHRLCNYNVRSMQEKHSHLDMYLS